MRQLYLVYASYGQAEHYKASSFSLLLDGLGRICLNWENDADVVAVSRD